jgi:aminoglycoside phosphotransferase (APT) family kinase protein
MSERAEVLRAALERAFARTQGPVSIANLHRLSGGASQETWGFDVSGALTGGFVLRHAPAGQIEPPIGKVTLETEAQIIDAVRARGVPTPEIAFVLRAEDGAGNGFVMPHVPGEALGARILRDPTLEARRAALAHECGAALAGIHSTDVGHIPGLQHRTAASQLAGMRLALHELGHPRPVFELAFRWLGDNMPAGTPTTLVHGDFRLGNFLLAPGGIQAVLDWELAHIGDPAEDLGWLCVPSWRFGVIEKPVGGFGDYDQLIEGYVGAGGDPGVAERIHFYEVFGVLKWGVICARALETLRSGVELSVERAMIARRTSETELDILRLLDPDWSAARAG